MSVNLSPRELTSELPSHVRLALHAAGVSAQDLTLEITESVLMGDSQTTLAKLHSLRELGVRIALDDFGTGYSSLSYLHRFPFDKIKIDRSFISDIGQSEDSSPIVQAVVHMAAARHMATTAEGVETEAQREVLRQLGCSQMQGWLFSPAVPAAKLKQLLSKQAAAA